jgi:hypothetical protein
LNDHRVRRPDPEELIPIGDGLVEIVLFAEAVVTLGEEQVGDLLRVAHLFLRGEHPQILFHLLDGLVVFAALEVLERAVLELGKLGGAGIEIARLACPRGQAPGPKQRPAIAQAASRARKRFMWEFVG